MIKKGRNCQGKFPVLSAVRCAVCTAVRRPHAEVDRVHATMIPCLLSVRPGQAEVSLRSSSSPPGRGRCAVTNGWEWSWYGFYTGANDCDAREPIWFCSRCRAAVREVSVWHGTYAADQHVLTHPDPGVGSPDSGLMLIIKSNARHQTARRTPARPRPRPRPSEPEARRQQY